MKIRLIPLLALVLAGLNFQSADAATAVSFSAGVEIHAAADFYAPLTPYGSWVEVGSYGRCWRPTGIAVGWRPYATGYWEWTDCGWYWVSDEPYAWACYHYGYWVYDSDLGWVWVPGMEWSPAWVVWRESDAYIGWAPCGPRRTVVAPSLFVFVEVGHFADPIRPNSVIVNNTTIIKNTTVVNNFRSETRNIDGNQQTVMVNAGPSVTKVQHATGKSFTATPITTAVAKTPMPSNIRHSSERVGEKPAPAPLREKSSIKEPSGAKPEAPAAKPEPTLPREERRKVETPEPPHRTAPPPVSPSQHAPTPPPTRVVPQVPHGPPVDHDRGHGRGHDLP